MAVVALTVVLSGCATSKDTVPGPSPRVTPESSPQVTPEPAPVKGQTGEASWYGQPHTGRPTASGEIFDMNQLTAAHRTLPFGTRALVTNLKNGRSVEVRINDRGPRVAGRIIDLSFAAAQALGFASGGTIPVRIQVLALPPQ